MHCSVCGKELTVPESIAAGMGPICRSRMKDEMDTATRYRMRFLSTPLDRGVILKRTATGVATNVPWLVKDHSPDGYEWGYGGSGPADLALNILESVLKRMGHRGKRSEIAWSGVECFRVAYRLHQEFKEVFIVGMPEEGGVIPIGDVQAWIAKKIHKQRSLF